MKKVKVKKIRVESENESGEEGEEVEDELEDGVELNRSGNIDDNYNNWSRGEDFFEGRDTQHKLVYKNLVYEQYKWDGRNLFYYVNKDGELVLKVNEAQTYTGYVEPYSS